jgi:predicted amidohydrolase
MGEKRLKVAAVQLAAQAMEAAEGVWPRIERWVREAAGAGCGLVVIPECSYPAYVLGSAERARGADILGRAEIVARFSAMARENRITLVAGFAEDFDGKLWNSAGVWDSAGRLLGVQRKTFLFDCDNKWFSHGTSIEPIATEHGRIGIVICADARAPEVSATLVNRGAELIVVPTAWVNMAKGAGEYWNVQPDCLIRARAMEFGVAYVCADKCGSEPPLQYVGFSQIVDATGGTVATAGPVDEACVVGEVAVGPGRQSVVRSDLLGVLQGGYERTADPIIRSSFVRMTYEELRTYPAVRAAALRGARMVVFPEVSEGDFPLLRARAAENRIFVGASLNRSAWMAGPDGRVIEVGTVKTIDPALADDKRVTPLTDIFEQRRPELYQFQPS